MSGLDHVFIALLLPRFEKTVKEDALTSDYRSIHLVHDDNKDKEFELEMTWVCEASGMKHALVPADLMAEADAKAKAALEEGMEED